METLEEALSAVLNKIAARSEMIQSLVGFHWAII
jgi:hypothetical protein